MLINLFLEGNITTLYSSLQGGSKKRKLSQDLSSTGSGQILYVKQEKPETNTGDWILAFANFNVLL